MGGASELVRPSSVAACNQFLIWGEKIKPFFFFLSSLLFHVKVLLVRCVCGGGGWGSGAEQNFDISSCVHVRLIIPCACAQALLVIHVFRWCIKCCSRPFSHMTSPAPQREEGNQKEVGGSGMMKDGRSQSLEDDRNEIELPLRNQRKNLGVKGRFWFNIMRHV